MKPCAKSAKAKPMLHIYLSDGKIIYFPLASGRISVGRSYANDIHLQDLYCSSHHAFLSTDDEGYVIRDNNSKNGTFLNGNRISEKMKLKKGDEILIGITRIIYESENSFKYH